MKIRISEWKLATKLIVVNLSAILVLGSILSLVFISFKNIEYLVSGIVKKEVPQVIDNGQIGNKLTGMFADLLMGMFYREGERIRANSEEFEQIIKAMQDVNPGLKSSLEEFRPKLAAVIEKFTLIRNIAEKFKIIESDFIYTLETLQDKISEQIEIIDNDDSPVMRHMEQLKSLGTRYREVFLEITLQVAELRGGNMPQSGMAEDHSIISDMNYLNLSLETLLAAEPDISEQGKKLIDIIQNYKETLILFLNVVSDFQKLIRKVSDSKERVMTVLKDTNRQIADSAVNTQKRIDSRTQMTGKIIILLSGGVLIVSLLITYSVFKTFRIESDAKLLAREMELARKLQTCLLPTFFDNIHQDFEIAATMLPADEVGGDFYEITLDRSGHLWISIGDVSGHGVTPGLIMMMAQTIHATVTASFEYNARDVVVKINEILYKNVRERLNETHFMTFTTLKYMEEGRFQHAGAHLSMVVYRQKTGVCELVRTRGVYLNFKKDISKATKNAEFSLAPGDILVLYTDGLTEAENADGEMLDLDGFVNIVEKHACQNPEAMKDMIMADVIRWCDDNRADDMTLVIVKRKQHVSEPLPGTV
ncbi:PP2C family protein-serine/threonine phosphatase [Desulfonema magnum]|uniref:PPM-type phosphatase domain-containing protein n=1 Tax=Desulfonema magnum TaxID=45655 RepID=A0A975BTW4_9BACT|nr:PP2C family protein-serine/threonine phosphatase [Desulfonema magnum]QTA91639.1 PPM-type phosphatase domain-containing protein [Desulfonema magnum]